LLLRLVQRFVGLTDPIAETRRSLMASREAAAERDRRMRSLGQKFERDCGELFCCGSDPVGRDCDIGVDDQGELFSPSRLQADVQRAALKEHGPALTSRRPLHFRLFGVAFVRSCA
jgi:hypothetical protein